MWDQDWEMARESKPDRVEMEEGVTRGRTRPE